MNYCNYCQYPLDTGSNACPNCGALHGQPGAAFQYPAFAPAFATDQAPTVYQAPSQPESYAPPPAPATPTPNGQPGKKPRSKKPFILAGALVLAILLGLGGFMGYNAFTEHQRSLAYANSVTLMEQGNYEAALAGFNDLGEYEDAEKHAEYCVKALSFQDASALLESGNYAEAANLFAMLGTFMGADEQLEICKAWIAFEEAEALTEEGLYDEALEKSFLFDSVSAVSNDPQVTLWRNKNAYGIADQLFTNGQFNNAYLGFLELGDYEDAAARAEACIQPTPDTGELYHNEGFVSSSTDLVFEAGISTSPFYLKIYSGDALVSAIFLHPGASTTITVPAGDYVIKKASGEKWFGEQDMFGIDGHYQVLIFGDTGESVHIDGNMIYTITLHYEGAGNVGDRSVDAADF